MSQLFRVLYDFDAEEDGEMTISAGDIVKILPQESEESWDDPRNGWVFVQATRNGNSGYVPIDYLEPMQNQTPQPQPPSLSKSISTPVQASSSSSPASHLLPQQQQQPPKLASTMSTPPSVFSTPEPSQGLRMSLSSLMDKAKSDPSLTQNNNKQSHQQQQPPQQQSSTHSKTTPQAKTKLEPTSTALPFGLSDTKSASGGGGGGGPSSSSLSALKKGGKLLKAAKTVQNMVKVTNVIATPRVPALSTAVEREDFDELLKRNDEYFARLLSSQAETFESLTDMVDALTKKLNESVKCSTDLVSKLSELDELIDEEKRKWKQQNEAEKNADVLGRTKELIRGNDDSSRYSDYE